MLRFLSAEGVTIGCEFSINLLLEIAFVFCLLLSYNLTQIVVATLLVFASKLSKGVTMNTPEHPQGVPHDTRSTHIGNLIQYRYTISSRPQGTRQVTDLPLVVG
jgi:hypothetical protein